MKTVKAKVILTAIFMLIGGGAGYLYYYYKGCQGTCLIASYPTRTMIYCAIAAGILSTVFWKKNDKKEE